MGKDDELKSAAENGNAAAVKRLLGEGANVHSKDYSGWTPLHVASNNDHSSVVPLLLAANADVNAKNVRGETPLHSALYNGHSSVVPLLLAANADVHAKTNSGGRTPLHLASYHGKSSVVPLLLAAGADPTIKNDDGDTALDFARVGNHSEVVQLLQAHATAPPAPARAPAPAPPPMPTPKLLPPTHVEVAAALDGAAASATLTWQAAVATDCTLGSYRLRYIIGNEVKGNVEPDADAVSYRIGGLTPGAEYTFELRATAAGVPDAGAPRVRKTMPEPTTPAKTPAQGTFAPAWAVASSALQWSREIGRGSFGAVYEVTLGGAKLAAKKMSFVTDDERARIEGLLRNEFRALSQVQHPHIVRLHGVVTDEPKSLSLLMELSPIGSLRGLLDKTPDAVTSSEKAQLSILTGIALGMAYLHDQKPKPVLHHDLKSDNVLVWPDAACGFIGKITDFGLASGTQGSTMRTTRKQTGAATLAYKAPECFRKPKDGSNPFTTASEVYAFGIVAWEVLTGKVPWAGYDEAELTYAITVDKEELPLPDALAAAPSGQMVQRCWAQEPSKRPTFAALATALEAADRTPPRFGVSDHVQSMASEAVDAALAALGFNVVATPSVALARRREKLLELIGDAEGTNWPGVLEAAMKQRVGSFLSQFLTESAAERAAAKAIDTYQGEAKEMWRRLLLEYCPPAPLAPDRSGKRVLAIGPGFGFLQNPEQIRIVERAGYDVHRLLCPNPEDASFNMAIEIVPVLKTIKTFKPDAILCASKGGAYMVELWKRMEAGEVDKGIACLMINAHPKATALPKGVRVVLVQGSEEQIWPKPRGYTDYGQVEDGSLEALIRGGTEKLCMLYYTVTQGGMRQRKGDDHNPASLLKYDCLPRLVDALLSPFPPFAFPASSASFTSEARRLHENFLGFEPRSLRRFWASADQKGRDVQMRFRVPDGSDEFNAVLGLFQAEPTVDRFYAPRSKIGEEVEVAYIERIENGNLHENMDTGYGNIKSNFAKLGVDFQGGVHTRWLFHGAGYANTVEAIVEDPSNGFQPMANQRALWGQGTYFARDAAYCWKLNNCCDTCLDSEGHMMIVVCLVVVGMPCLGQEGLRILPKIHPELLPKQRYGSMVDDLSNPEMFVVQNGADVYPAYIIHFS